MPKVPVRQVQFSSPDVEFIAHCLSKETLAKVIEVQLNGGELQKAKVYYEAFKSKHKKVEIQPLFLDSKTYNKLKSIK